MKLESVIKIITVQGCHFLTLGFFVKARGKSLVIRLIDLFIVQYKQILTDVVKNTGTVGAKGLEGDIHRREHSQGTIF